MGRSWTREESRISIATLRASAFSFEPAGVEQLAFVTVVGIGAAVASEVGGEIVPEVRHPHIAMLSQKLVGVIVG